MVFSRKIEAAQLANDDFEMFVNCSKAVPRLQPARLQQTKISEKLQSIKVYEVRRLPIVCNSLQYYKKEVEISVNYSDSEEDVEMSAAATPTSLIRTSSIRQAYRRKRSETCDMNLAKIKGSKLKRGKMLRFNKEGYAYRMWKNLMKIGNRE